MTMKKFFALLLFSALLPGMARSELTSYTPWSEEAVKIFTAIPVQYEGRIMPMGTFAYAQLMTLRGKSTVSFQAGGKKFRLGADEWLMDVFFRPHIATQLPIFKVDDSNVMTAIGAVAKDKKRTDYSFEDILPARETLANMAREIAGREQAIEQAEQNGEVPPAPPGALDALILILGQRANQYDYLAATVSYAKAGNLINGEAVLPPDVIAVAAARPMSGLIEIAEQATVEEMLQLMRTQQPDS
ncbi:MAG: hypothetical protein ACI8UO_003025, partial [Verrucomicrobiales bacterium]